MTKERLKVMTILDTMFIIAFGYSTIASWGVYESYYTITYFAITVFLMAIMCDRIYCYIHKNVTDKIVEFKILKSNILITKLIRLKRLTLVIGLICVLLKQFS